MFRSRFRGPHAPRSLKNEWQRMEDAHLGVVPWIQQRTIREFLVTLQAISLQYGEVINFNTTKVRPRLALLLVS